MCNKNNCSEKSTKTLLQAYVPKEKSANLGMSILEFAVLTDGINIFPETCYILEGDSTTVLISVVFFNRLEHVIYDDYKHTSVNIVVDDSSGLIIKRRGTFLHQKNISSTKLDAEKQLFLKLMIVRKN